MFEEYVEKISKNNDQKDYIELNLMDNVSINIDTLIKKIKNIDELSDQELTKIVKESYALILENIFASKDSSLAIKLFTNARFITIMTQSLYSIRLTKLQRIYCNRISYDYIAPSSLKKDDNIKNLLINLSKVVNRDVIPGLLSLNLNEELSSYLAMARFSSEKENINVRRVNFIITQQPCSLMTEQKIINIYEKLFDHIIPLFEGTMFENLDFVDDNSNEVYATISLAILDILNEMPMDMIIKVLKSYTQTKLLLHPDEKTRFNLRSISQQDYKRILDAIDYLQNEEEIFVY